MKAKGYPFPMKATLAEVGRSQAHVQQLRYPVWQEWGSVTQTIILPKFGLDDMHSLTNGYIGEERGHIKTDQHLTLS